MTPDWWRVLWVVLTVVGTLIFLGVMLVVFVGRFSKWIDLDSTLKQQNDDINAQVEQSEMPGTNKLEPGESPKKWRKRWGLGDK